MPWASTVLERWLKPVNPIIFLLSLVWLLSVLAHFIEEPCSKTRTPVEVVCMSIFEVGGVCLMLRFRVLFLVAFSLKIWLVEKEILKKLVHGVYIYVDNFAYFLISKLNCARSYPNTPSSTDHIFCHHHFIPIPLFVFLPPAEHTSHRGERIYTEHTEM